MADLALIKTPHGLHPADAETGDYIAKLPSSQVLHGKFVRARNGAFMRKFFAMLNVGFDLWTGNKEHIEVEWKGKTIPARKTAEGFREWVTIKAGYHETVFFPDGSFKLRAKSISFAKMDEDEFEKLYSSVLNVIIDLLDISKEDYENSVNMMLDFA